MWLFELRSGIPFLRIISKKFSHYTFQYLPSSPFQLSPGALIKHSMPFHSLCIFLNQTSHIYTPFVLASFENLHWVSSFHDYMPLHFSFLRAPSGVFCQSLAHLNSLWFLHSLIFFSDFFHCVNIYILFLKIAICGLLAWFSKPSCFLSIFFIIIDATWNFIFGAWF